MQLLVIGLIFVAWGLQASPITTAACTSGATVVTVDGTAEASCSAPYVSASSVATFELLDAGLQARIVVGGIARIEEQAPSDLLLSAQSYASDARVLFTSGPLRDGIVRFEVDYRSSGSGQVSVSTLSSGAWQVVLGYGWENQGGSIEDSAPISLGIPLQAMLSSETGAGVPCRFSGCSQFDSTVIVSVYEADGVTPVRLSLEPATVAPETTSGAMLLWGFGVGGFCRIMRTKWRPTSKRYTVTLFPEG